MSFKSNTKTSLSKGKARSLVKYTNASQPPESSRVTNVIKDTGEDTNPIANGEVLAKELQLNSQEISTSPKEHAPIHQISQTSTTSHETPTNQVLTPQTGIKRKMEEEEQQQVKPVKKK